VFFLIEQVTAVVVGVVVAVALGIVVMVILAIQRRQIRDRYFERLDAYRHEYSPVINALLDGSLEYRNGLQKLNQLSGRDRMRMLERLILEKERPPEQLPILQRLCQDLGLVTEWQQHLAGGENGPIRAPFFSVEGLIQRLGRLEFLTRATSAENLGVIRHQPSWPVLVQAVKDRHPDVQAVSVHALALIGEPQSFPVLLDRLQAVILEPATPLSLRAVKTAVVSFPLGMASQLVPLLQHPHRRIRFLATDVIREMVEREAAKDREFVLNAGKFAPELAQMFLTRLPVDENPDVRARSAPVISYLPDPQATRVLLALLEDPVWFVRLHGVRALAKHKFTTEVDSIAARLTDRNWMVREAAVHTLQQLNRLEYLTDAFLRTADRYGKEQIADEWQRAGVIPTLLFKYAQDNSEQEGQVISQLANMGKTSYMLAVVHYSTDRDLRKKFLTDFGRHPDPQIQHWVAEMAEHERDAELRALAQASLPARRR
jgi:HEAT repeat protein